MPSSAPPSVTAIFLSYNCEAYVADALLSLLDQDYGLPMEIVVSDDASRDRTFEIAQEVLMQYRGQHRVLLSRSANNSGTKSAHLNRIFPQTSGEILISFDSDDISERSRVSKVVDRFRADPYVQAVYSSLTLIDRSGRPLGAGRVPHAPVGVDASVWFARVDAYAAGATLAIRRDVVEKFGPLEPDINEDIVLPFRASLLGSVEYIDEPLIRYRRYMGSLTADLEQFGSIAAYRARMRLGIERARRNVESRLADIHRATALMPDRMSEFQALQGIVHDSLAKAEMTELLLSSSMISRASALLRLIRSGAYRDELLQHACVALMPRLYLSYKRRLLGIEGDNS